MGRQPPVCFRDASRVLVVRLRWIFSNRDFLAIPEVLLAVQFALVALLLAPWVIRNARELGSPIVTRSNFGLELRLSNNGLAGPLERENYEHGVYHVYHPLQSVKQAERVKALGEPEFNRQSTQEAFTWMREHPAQFLKLTAERMFFFLVPTNSGTSGKSGVAGASRAAGLSGPLGAGAQRYVGCHANGVAFPGGAATQLSGPCRIASSLPAGLDLSAAGGLLRL